ncbi:MAG: hypothetical protein J7L47_02740 [Candidatus Odinarchaeota archaeon]|nr:hypothetical protein [Candidatus Odinarchaeota archaeon]
MDYRSLFVKTFTQRKPVIEPFLFHQVATVPFMEKSQSFWPEAHLNPDLMAKLAIAPVRFSCFNQYVVPFGLTAEAEVIGATVNYGSKRSPPTVVGSIKDIEDIKIPENFEAKPLATIIDAVQIIRDYDNTRPIIGSMCGPFTILAQALGIQNTMRYIMKNPEPLKDALTMLEKFVVDLNDYLVEQGADIIVILEPVSSLLGPKYFGIFSKPHLSYVVSQLRVPVILHICGNATPILEQILEINPAGFSFDHLTYLPEAKRILKGKVNLVGNVDPVMVLWRGNKEKIVNATFEALRGGVDVPAPGCGLAIDTPIENLEIFCAAVKRYKEQENVSNS